MNAFPSLETPRLRLRRMQTSDIPSLLKYVNNIKITDQILNFPYPYLEEDAIFRMHIILQGFQKKQRFVFAITQKEEDELIGEIGLHLDKANNRAEMGYWLGEPFWNQGLMKEAIGPVLKFGFEEVKLHKIFATHFISNPASGKIMEQNGMIREAEMKDHYKKKGIYETVFQYRLTKEEFEAFVSSQ
ncbi:MAG: GNAT family protein [Bacteroidota bacterium]